MSQDKSEHISHLSIYLQNSNVKTLCLNEVLCNIFTNYLPILSHFEVFEYKFLNTKHLKIIVFYIAHLGVMLVILALFNKFAFGALEFFQYIQWKLYLIHLQNNFSCGNIVSTHEKFLTILKYNNICRTTSWTAKTFTVFPINTILYLKNNMIYLLRSIFCK